MPHFALMDVDPFQTLQTYGRNMKKHYATSDMSEDLKDNPNVQTHMRETPLCKSVDFG